MPGQRFVRKYRFLFCHLVFQYVFDKCIGAVLMVNSHLTGLLKAAFLSYSVQAKDSFTSPVKLFGISVLSNYLRDELVKYR